MGKVKTNTNCGNWRDALEVLEELGCSVEKKFRTGEYRITAPDGSVHLAGSTRKDTPGHVKQLIKRLSRE